jgi:hypothetical protein
VPDCQYLFSLQFLLTCTVAQKTPRPGAGIIPCQLEPLSAQPHSLACVPCTALPSGLVAFHPTLPHSTHPLSTLLQTLLPSPQTLISTAGLHSCSDDDGNCPESYFFRQTLDPSYRSIWGRGVGSASRLNLQPINLFVIQTHLKA